MRKQPKNKTKTKATMPPGGSKRHVRAPYNDKGYIDPQSNTTAALRAAFKKDQQAGLSLRLIAIKYYDDPTEFGNVARIIAGQDIKQKETRERLGLTPLVEVEACPACGRAHVLTGPCPDLRPEPKPRARISINTANPESAAQSIINLCKPDFVQELIEILQSEVIR